MRISFCGLLLLGLICTCVVHRLEDQLSFNISCVLLIHCVLGTPRLVPYAGSWFAPIHRGATRARAWGH